MFDMAEDVPYGSFVPVRSLNVFFSPESNISIVSFFLFCTDHVSGVFNTITNVIR